MISFVSSVIGITIDAVGAGVFASSPLVIPFVFLPLFAVLAFLRRLCHRG